MNRYFYTSVLALALVTAYAVSQTGTPPSSQPSNQPQSTTPDASQSTTPSSSNPSKGTADQSMPQSDQTGAATDDQALHTKVHEQLSTNPALSNVNVTVNGGVVTLEGSVATKADRKEAEKAAQSVPGVKKVKDKLKVEAANAAPPPSSYFAGSQTSSSTTPPSQDTGSTSGSTQGQSSQTGAQSSGQAGTTSGMPQGDMNAASTDNSTLQNQIQTALKNEPTLANDSITVNVTDGAVELSGTAASKKERQTAQRIAQSYANNRKVTDHITISGSSSTTTSPSSTTPPDKTTNPEDKGGQTNPPPQPPDQSYPK